MRRGALKSGEVACERREGALPRQRPPARVRLVGQSRNRADPPRTPLTLRPMVADSRNARRMLLKATTNFVPILYPSHLISADFSRPQMACSGQVEPRTTPMGQAHNPEVAASNPAPATTKGAGNGAFRRSWRGACRNDALAWVPRVKCGKLGRRHTVDSCGPSDSGGEFALSPRICQPSRRFYPG
jgi:hypothetical protein